MKQFKIILLSLIVLWAALNTANAAIFTIFNADFVGEGLNDITPASPVGGNPGNTIGGQRNYVVQQVLNEWGARIYSPVPIQVEVAFDPLTCTNSQAVLGAAGPTTVAKSYFDKGRTIAWSPAALVNSQSGYDAIGGLTSDITAVFNTVLGHHQDCLGGAAWYYGTDGNTPQGMVDFYSVVLHEIGHGLGFTSLVDGETGDKFYGYDDVFSRNLESHTTHKQWSSMNDEERVLSSTETGNLHWVGDQLKNHTRNNALLTGSTQTGHVDMYAPATYSSGSSVTHFSDTLSPDNLMEPYITADARDLTLASTLLEDIGWESMPLQNVSAINPANISFTPDEVKVGNDGTIYLLSKTHQNIFRYSTATQSYLPSIPLNGRAKYMDYSSTNNSLYLAYNADHVSVINLDTGIIENRIYTVRGLLCGLFVAGDKVVVCGPSRLPGNSGLLLGRANYYVFELDGSLLKINENNDYLAYDFEWNDTNQAFYFIRKNIAPLDLFSGTITADGTISTIDSPLNNVPGFQGDIRVSDDGSTLLIGSGKMHDAVTLDRTGTIGSLFDDGVWLNNNFISATSNAYQTSLKVWSANLLEHTTYSLSGQLLGMSAFNDRVFIVSKVNGRVKYYTLIPDSIDLDGDGIQNDLDDFPFDPLRSQDTVDSDGDGMSDRFEEIYGFDSNDPNDAVLDYDNDGIVNLDEFIAGTDPKNDDSDADGIPDNIDINPITPSIQTGYKPVLVQTKRYQDTIYLLFSSPRLIKRYDAVGRQFLSDIYLSEQAKEFDVDSDGLFIQYSHHIERMTHDGASHNTMFAEPLAEISGILSAGQFIYTSSIVNGSGEFISVNKSSLTSFRRKMYRPFQFAATDSLRSKIFTKTPYILNQLAHRLISITLDGAGDYVSETVNPNSFYENRVYVTANETAITDYTGTLWDFNNINMEVGVLQGRIDDVTNIGDQTIVLKDGLLTRYSSTLSFVDQFNTCHVSQSIIDHNNMIVEFSFDDSNQLQAQHIDLTQFSGSNTCAPVDPVGLVYTPDEVFLDSSGLVNLVSKSNRSIFQWSPVLQAYTQSISLQGTPSFTTYSPERNTVYIGYDSGVITQIRLDFGLQEEVFSVVQGNVCGIVSAGDFIVACRDYGVNQFFFVSFDPAGVEVSEQKGYARAQQLVWSDKKDLIYYFTHPTNRSRILNPDDLHAISLDKQTGELGFGLYYPYRVLLYSADPVRNHSTSFKPPIRISSDGENVLIGDGRVYDSKEITESGFLGNAIIDGIWINGKLITIRPDLVDNQITSTEAWDNDNSLFSAISYTGSPVAVKNINNQIITITLVSGIPAFNLLDANQGPDADADTFNDFVDVCPALSNAATQNNTDLDMLGDDCDTDDDNDGMPDTFEITQGLDPLNKADGQFDNDNDLYENTIEYQFATDINNPNSIPALFTEGNLIISDGRINVGGYGACINTIREYTLDGGLVNEIEAPQYAKDINGTLSCMGDPVILEDGRLAVVNSTLTGDGGISVYNGQWSYLPIQRFSSDAAQVKGNRLVTYRNYIYLLPARFGTYSPIIRYDINTGLTEEFLPKNSYRGIAIGQDGLLYASLENNFIQRFVVIDPITMIELSSSNIFTIVQPQFVVTSEGNIINADIGQKIFEQDASGQVLKSFNTGLDDRIFEIEQDALGNIIARSGSIFSFITVLDESLNGIKHSYRVNGANFTHVPYRDSDNDGVPDFIDAFVNNPAESKDTDNDGIGDNSDTDLDGDGVLNSDGSDNCPTISNVTQLDTDLDGLGDACDNDDDNDGVLDEKDGYPLDPLLSNHAPIIINQPGLNKIFSENRGGSGTDYYGAGVGIDENIIAVTRNVRYLNYEYQPGLFIYEKLPDGSWDKTFKAPIDVLWDSFGNDVEVHNNHVVVSANSKDGLDEQTGAIYVYERQSTGNWLETKITASDASRFDKFGYGIDINNDRIIVGAPHALTAQGEVHLGAAYIYEKQVDNSWLEIKLLPSNRSADDYFGTAVSIDGDRAIVLAQTDTFQSNPTPAAIYVFERQLNGDWVEVERITYGGLTGTISPRSSIDLKSNIIAVGDQFDSVKGKHAGSVYIFEQQLDGSWVQQQRLFASDAGQDYNFGAELALSNNRLIVGAQALSDHALPGKAYLFEKMANGDWFETSILSDPLVPINRVGSDNDFGSHVAIDDKHVLIHTRNYSNRKGQINTYDFLQPTIYPVTQNAAEPIGTPISHPALFIPHFSDVDYDSFAGVAIVENASIASEGSWQYSVDNGVSWSTIPTIINDTNAIVLSISDQLRFVPAADYTGLPGGISVRLWDGFAFSPGFNVDISNEIGTNRGFSAETINVSAQVGVGDIDNDGLPNEWELKYGFDPLISGQQFQNSDTDSWNNLTEFQNGTNPRLADTDSDTVIDSLDAFPLDPFESVDTDNDGIGNNADTDDDNDGLSDSEEAALGSNPLLVDSDGDGVNDILDLFPINPLESVDADIDGVGDNSDNCPAVANADQLNTDGDGQGNACDADDDNDGLSDSQEVTLGTNPLLADSDGDGVNDRLDLFPSNPMESADADIDGVGDNADNCPAVANTDQLNTDGDAQGNVCDADDDNDGLVDTEELALGTNPLLADTDSDGTDDSIDYYPNDPARQVIDNYEATAEILVAQLGTNTRTIVSSNGVVEVSVLINDINPADTHSYDWSASDAEIVANNAYVGSAFSFDPSAMPVGYYSIRLALTDSGAPSNTTNFEIPVRVVNQLPVLLTTMDSDGDGIDDLAEGYIDTDNDGIEDYKDRVNLPNQIAIDNTTVVSTEIGYSLTLGKVSFRNYFNNSAHTYKDMALANLMYSRQFEIADADYSVSSRLANFEIHGMAVDSDVISALVVIPQPVPIVENAKYRIVNAAYEVVPFVLDAVNIVYTAADTNGICPEAGNPVYTAGFNAGDTCVQLRIQDGGVNDPDGQRNGVISHTGGVGDALEVVNNAPPIPGLVSPLDGSADIDGSSVEFKWNSVEDIDGDSVTYSFYLCDNAGFIGCEIEQLQLANVGLYMSAGLGSLVLASFMAPYSRRKKYSLSGVFAIALLMVSCGGGSSDKNPPAENLGPQAMTYTATNLQSATQYYWKVVVDDGRGGVSVTDVVSFTTQ